MKRTKISASPESFPRELFEIFRDADIYDSSCSPEARVYYINKDNGYYLKMSAKGSLNAEAVLTEYFNSKNIGTKVLKYLSLDKDWLLTEKVCGEDCTHGIYLENPKKLCDITAGLLRQLHELDFTDCPVQNHSERYINTVISNYKTGNYDKTAFPDSFGYKNAEEAFLVVEKYKNNLKSDTLLHGDYCLPNIMLDNWKFSKFIDLGNGGVGDRHVDVFWGIWTLFFNLKTNEYASRFIDAYGRDKIDTDMLRFIAACEVFG